MRPGPGLHPPRCGGRRYPWPGSGAQLPWLEVWAVRAGVAATAGDTAGATAVAAAGVAVVAAAALDDGTALVEVPAALEAVADVAADVAEGAAVVAPAAG